MSQYLIGILILIVAGLIYWTVYEWWPISDEEIEREIRREEAEGGDVDHYEWH